MTGRWTLGGAALGGATLGEELERVLRPLADGAGSPAELSADGAGPLPDGGLPGGGLLDSGRPADETVEPLGGLRAETRLDQVVRVFRLSGF